MKQKISICIPFFDTHDLTRNFLDTIVNENFVDEIVISDDSSKNNFLYSHPKVKIFRNEINQGAFRNKFLTVSKASNDWVLLLDSDNAVDKQVLKKIFNFYYKINYLYLPKKLVLESLENFDDKMHKFEMNYDFDKIIDLNSASKYLVNKNQKIEWLLNTGNFIINKFEYLEVSKKYFLDNQASYLDCDALVFTYLWLKSGRKIQILDSYFTYHRLRKSSWTNTAKNNWQSQKLHIFLIKFKGKYKNLYLFYQNIKSIVIFIKNFIKSLLK